MNRFSSRRQRAEEDDRNKTAAATLADIGYEEEYDDNNNHDNVSPALAFTLHEGDMISASNSMRSSTTSATNTNTNTNMADKESGSGAGAGAGADHSIEVIATTTPRTKNDNTDNNRNNNKNSNNNRRRPSASKNANSNNTSRFASFLSSPSSQQQQQQQQRQQLERKPSQDSSKIEEDEGDGPGSGNSSGNGNTGGQRPNLRSTPSGRSFRLEWSMEQYGHRRYWFRELLDWYNQFRFNCGMFVNNGKVQFIIILLITINAIMMGIATFKFVKQNEELKDIFEQIDQVFLIIFTIELGLQFIYHGWKLIQDGWLVFDLVIIATSWSFGQVQIIRAFRIFRALRLVTRIKIMKNLILALFGVMPRMAAIGLMLALIFYIFAVMFTQLFKNLYEEGKTDFDYFSGIDATLFTLFQMMTLDNWATIARQVINVYRWAWFPFITFVIISGFIVVNLIIAVICDAISALHKDDKAKLHGDYEEDSDSEQSQQLEIREQLDCLEEQMEELTRIQARTFHTLQYLTRQMQMHKLKQELQKKNPGLDVNKSSSKGGKGKKSTSAPSPTLKLGKSSSATTTTAAAPSSRSMMKRNVSLRSGF